MASGTDASLWPQPKDRIGEIDFGDDNNDGDDNEETLMKVLPQTRH